MTGQPQLDEISRAIGGLETGQKACHEQNARLEGKVDQGFKDLRQEMREYIAEVRGRHHSAANATQVVVGKVENRVKAIEMARSVEAGTHKANKWWLGTLQMVVGGAITLGATVAAEFFRR